MRRTEEIVQRRTKGYIKFPRMFVYLLIENRISDSDFAFYYRLACLARFDRRNPLYEVVELTISELATVLNLNEKTVRNHIKRLIAVGLISKEEKYYRISQYEQIFSNPGKFFTSGNQREKARIFLPIKHAFLGEVVNKDTVYVDGLGRFDSQPPLHICDESMGSCKGNISSVVEERIGGDEYVNPDDIPF